MTQRKKSLQAVLSGTSDSNINFKDLESLLLALGFQVRIRGDHFIFTRDKMDEIINLQPIAAKAKAYQVKQVRGIILKYKLGEDLK